MIVSRWWLIGGLSGLALAAIAAYLVLGGPREPMRQPGPVGFYAVYVEPAAQLSLSVSSCGGGPEVKSLRETAEAVEITLATTEAFDATLTCADGTTVALENPLGQRDVVDGATGQVVTRVYGRAPGQTEEQS